MSRPVDEPAGVSALAPTPAPVTLPAQPPPHALAVMKADQREFLWKVHEYTNEYIRFADAKAGAVAVFCGALLGVLYSNELHKPLFTAPLGAWQLRDAVAAAAFVLLALGALAAAFSIRPRLPNPQPKGFIFWESVRAHPDGVSFANAAASESMDALGRHLAVHLHTIAGIASTKYWWGQVSILVTIAGAFCAAAALLLG
jgi:hypothetical protein